MKRKRPAGSGSTPPPSRAIQTRSHENETAAIAGSDRRGGEQAWPARLGCVAVTGRERLIRSRTPSDIAFRLLLAELRGTAGDRRVVGAGVRQAFPNVDTAGRLLRLRGNIHVRSADHGSGDGCPSRGLRDNADPRTSREHPARRSYLNTRDRTGPDRINVATAVQSPCGRMGRQTTRRSVRPRKRIGRSF